MNKLCRGVWYFVIILVAATTGKVLFSRHLLEEANCNVEITVPYEEVQQISLQTTDSLNVFLREMKQQGVSSISIKEQTLVDLQKQGRIMVFSPEQIKEFAFLNVLPPGLNKNAYPAQTLLIISVRPGQPDRQNANAFNQLREYFRGTFPNAKISKKGAEIFCTIPGDPEVLNKLGLGFSDAEIEQITSAGLEIVLRPENCLPTPKRIERLFSEVASIENLSGIIFSGEEVLGYPEFLEITRKHLREEKIKIGDIEFLRQKGFRELGKDLPLVRVHSIPPGRASEPEEISITEPKILVDRFVRAVRERNIRWLYVHLPAQTWSGNLGYLEKIKESVHKKGYKLTSAVPVRNYQPRFLLLFLLSLGIGGGAVYLCKNIFLLSNKKALILWSLLAGIFLLLAWQNLILALQIFAFLGAVTFPVLGFCSLDNNVVRPFQGRSHYIKTLLIFLYLSGITLLGGLLVTALLSRTTFFLQIDQFRGIKLAYIFPLLIFLFILWSKEKDFFQQPLQLGECLLLLLIGAGILVMLLRSGNLGLGVSGVELKLREILEQTLGVRPRFKEFLIGHPALLLGIYLSRKEEQKLAVKLLWLVGMIGQVSLVNTFCHLATPLDVCLLRSFHGLWLGILGGVILIAFWQYIDHKDTKSRKII